VAERPGVRGAHRVAPDPLSASRAAPGSLVLRSWVRPGFAGWIEDLRRRRRPRPPGCAARGIGRCPASPGCFL